MAAAGHHLRKRLPGATKRSVTIEDDRATDEYSGRLLRHGTS